MTELLGFDAWGFGPSAAAAKAAGVLWRTWYSSYDATKDGPGDGPAQYGQVGIASVTNFETTIDRIMTGGSSGGQADMAHAVSEFAPRGMPPGAAVILSADEPIAPADFPQALTYYQGAYAEAQTLGGYLPGCYGEQALIAYLKTRGAVRVGWRSMSTAWPGGTSTAYCDLVQTGGGVIGGVSVDFDSALVPFFGQWTPGKLAPNLAQPQSAVQEDDMILHTITGSPEVWALSGSLYWHVADQGSLQSYLDQGVKRATITAAEHADILAAVAAAKTAPLSVDASALGAAIAAGLKLPTSFSGTFGR
jgi:hypothetical protein